VSLTKAAALSDLAGDGLLSRVVAGRKVVLVRIGADVRAYENRCAHLGLPICGGRLDGSSLVCPHHEWEYDARTGRGVNPATACLKAFPVSIEEGQILVDVG
jgi:toluene monooxygenase system ferredoxin subunit